MVYKVIVIPDMQVPYHDKKSLRAVEKYMADHKWDEYINLGDFMDFDCISSHNKNKLREVEAKRLFKDYEVANKILDRHQAIIRKKNKKAKFVLLEGNHEFRVERYIDTLPQLEGMIEVDIGLKLKERGFKWVRCSQKGDLYKLGEAYFHHGRFTNQYYSKKMVDYYGVNIFFGHNHDIQGFSKVNRGKNKTLVGQSLGCLCEYNQSYIQGNPTNWQQAFGVFYFFPNGLFTYYIPRIFNNKFVSPEGKVYDGNK